VHDVCNASDDAGALYKGRNPSARGNIVRYNLWRDIGSPMGHGTAAVYFDDGDGGDTVFGNIFVRCGYPGKGSFGTVFNHGGHDNIAENNIFVKLDRHLISSNLIDAQFPNYQRVIPKSQDHRLTVRREHLQAALRRVSLLVEEKSRRIQLSMSEGNLEISSSEGEIGMAKEQMPCEYQGPELTIAANYSYLLEPLKESAEENVALEFSEADKAITLKPVPEKDYFHIVMPMQIG
jgi:hypothetical protein